VTDSALSAEALARRELDAMSPDARGRLAHDFADFAYRRGAYVLKPDGTEVAIPPLLTPVAPPPEVRRRASLDARALVVGLSLITRDLMTTPSHEPLRQKLFGSFTPVEKAGLERTWRAAEGLATARVDYLPAADGKLYALEVNATIPAMQGYSDSVAEAWIREVGRTRAIFPTQLDRLVAENGRNADELLASILAHGERLGFRRGGRPALIAIITRPNDAQRGELDHYARRWVELGQDAWVATVDQVSFDSDGALLVGRRRPDLVYRHIFARRLAPTDAFARALLEPERHRILNPIASHLEVKGMLALLSEAAARDDEARRIGLPDDVVEATRRTVPWTRVLRAGAATGPRGETIADLAAFTRSEGARLVLKRSWDYGGKSVFLGTELDQPSAQGRLRELLGRGDERPIGWDDLVAHALSAEDAWVVQELVDAPQVEHLTVGAPDPRRPNLREVVARRLYVDFSAYTALGVEVLPTGGAVRAAQSRIVNILGGGGLAPLVADSVVRSLLA
jgi:hypothetical protein